MGTHKLQNPVRTPSPEIYQKNPRTYVSRWKLKCWTPPTDSRRKYSVSARSTKARTTNVTVFVERQYYPKHSDNFAPVRHRTATQTNHTQPRTPTKYTQSSHKSLHTMCTTITHTDNASSEHPQKHIPSRQRETLTTHHPMHKCAPQTETNAKHHTRDAHSTDAHIDTRTHRYTHT